MKKEQKKYSEAFKEEAVKLWEKNGRRAAETGKQLGIGQTYFLKWHRQLERRRAAPEQCPITQAKAQPVTAEADLAGEVKRLRRENARLQMEHDILKKAVGIFSEMPK